MIREKHTWQLVTALDNCRAAVLEESHTPRCIRTGRAVEMRENTDEVAKAVQERLAFGFKPQPFTVFRLCERGKERTIEAPTIDDAICHRAASRVMEPLVYKRMVPTSYCPVVGRGGLKLAKDLRRRIRKCEETCRIHNLTHRQPWKTWILKSDIRQFFPSVTYNVAMLAMERIFADREVMAYLAACFAFRDGIPIGAGYSAMIANAVLIPMDWSIVRRRDAWGYARYMDDTVVVCRSKSAAKSIHDEMEDQLALVGLTTADKWSKFPAAHHAVEIGGWRISAKGVYPSTRVERHIGRLLRRDPGRLPARSCKSLSSLYGYVANSDSYGLKQKWRCKNADRVFRKN